MKVTGIIAEYNPFHRGHEYQIKFIKETLRSDYVVAVMSGDYVQRGTPALLSKHVRAEMALRCGADLVLEMPVSISTASAEAFAMGGVSILQGLGVVDDLCFGSESGEITAIKELAQILSEEPDEYKQLLKAFLSEGLSFPAARSQALIEYFRNPRNFPGDDFDGVLTPLLNQISRILSSPNNILGVEYCKALYRLNSNIKPVTLQRKGMGYHEKVQADGSDIYKEFFASASAIREMISRESNNLNYHQIAEQVPEEISFLLEKNLTNGSFLTEDSLDTLLLYCLFKADTSDLIKYMDVSKDIAERIINRRNEISGFSQAAALLKTKETTQTRLQRALLHIILGIQAAPEQVPYARVLGFKKSSSMLLKEIKNQGTIPLLTKLADAESILDKNGFQLLQETTFASNLYEKLLCQKNNKSFVHEYQKEIIIL